MEKTHVFLIQIDSQSINPVQKKITELYPKTTYTLSLKSNNDSKVLFKIPSYELNEVIILKIKLMTGVLSIQNQPQDKIRSTSTNYSKVLMIGLGIFMASIMIATFLIPENPLENLTQSQMLLIQVSIALSISVWIFIYDKRSQEDIVKVISNINKTVNETNQTVKDLRD